MSSSDEGHRFQVLYKKSESPANWRTLTRLVLGLAGPHRDMRKSIGYKFVRDVMAEQVDVVVLMTCSKSTTRKASSEYHLGFALLSIQPELEAYLHLMCVAPGKGFGRQLLEFVKNLARTDLSREYNIQYLTLSSLVDTINFYRKMGFTHFEPGTGMSQENAETITPAALAVSHHFFHSAQEAFKNKEMADFIRLLLRNKLQHDKRARYLQQSSENGYLMALKL